MCRDTVAVHEAVVEYLPFRGWLLLGGAIIMVNATSDATHTQRIYESLGTLPLCLAYCEYASVEYLCCVTGHGHVRNGRTESESTAVGSLQYER